MRGFFKECDWIEEALMTWQGKWFGRHGYAPADAHVVTFSTDRWEAPSAGLLSHVIGLGRTCQTLTLVQMSVTGLMG